MTRMAVIRALAESAHKLILLRAVPPAQVPL
jgi:hypothetical protein